MYNPYNYNTNFKPQNNNTGNNIAMNNNAMATNFGSVKVLGSFYSIRDEKDINLIPNPQFQGQNVILVESTSDLIVKDSYGQTKKLLTMNNNKENVANVENTETAEDNNLSKNVKSNNMKIVNLNKKLDKILGVLKSKNIEVSDELF